MPCGGYQVKVIGTKRPRSHHPNAWQAKLASLLYSQPAKEFVVMHHKQEQTSGSASRRQPP